jgi:hypothetical protein
MKKLTAGKIRKDSLNRIKNKNQQVSSGARGYTIGVARVYSVNYEEFTIGLKVIKGGNQEYQRIPIALTFPGAGNRHFFGAMPEVGDYCVIGQMTQESSGGTTIPVILNWVPAGTWVGHDWMVTQPFSPEEYSMDPRDSTFVEGVYHRVRHKLRHMTPGNIVASSSQGSDLVLDEGVLLTNRRNTSIELRDSDQAIISRGLQSFQSYAGVRSYSGMVQRDAIRLPTSMFSDGKNWEPSSLINRDENRPFTDDELLGFSTPYPTGYLTPNDLFNRLGEDGELKDSPQSGVFLGTNVDPFYILQRGLFINAEGYALDNKYKNDAVYGGKSIYRVSTNPGSNAALGDKSFTEYRIEVSHTSDGILPVSEQTDGFDADRLPRTAQTSSDPNNSQGPFLEWSLGTIVGNDPYSIKGRELYGIPLQTRVFDLSGKLNPEIISALGVPVEKQAASLFRMNPPIKNGEPSFWSISKEGKFTAFIGGKENENTVDVGIRGNMRVYASGEINIKSGKGVNLDLKSDNPSNMALNLESSDSAIRIYAGGKSTTGDLAKLTAPVGDGLPDSPNLTLEAKDNILLKSSRKAQVNTGTLEVSSSAVNVNTLSNTSINSGDRIGLSSKTFDLICNGKANFSFHGPKDLLPTNGSFRSTTFAGIAVGVVDESLYVSGDREETFLLGNHKTSVLLGNMTYETEAGIWTARATGNSLTVDSISGITASAAVGNISLNATVGGLQMSGQTNVLIRSSGPAVFSGVSGVTLGGPGKFGGIVSSSDLDPLTGLPLLTFGMGSPGHLLGPAV